MSLRAELLVAGKPDSTNTHFFRPYKGLSLPAAKVAAEAARAGGGFVITLTADTQMKVVIMKGAVVAASLLLFCGYVWSPSRAADRVTQPRERAGGGSGSKTSQIKALFDERCARCHGRDGRGQTRLGEMLEPPDFADAEWQKSASDERMRNSIRDGVGQMPAFARKLSRSEIMALVAYVRGFAKPGR